MHSQEDQINQLKDQLLAIQQQSQNSSALHY